MLNINPDTLCSLIQAIMMKFLRIAHGSFRILPYIEVWQAAQTIKPLEGPYVYQETIAQDFIALFSAKIKMNQNPIGQELRFMLKMKPVLMWITANSLIIKQPILMASQMVVR